MKKILQIALTIASISTMASLATTPNPAAAAPEALFSTDMQSAYRFGPYTFAQVRHRIKISATQKKYVPTSYHLETGTKSIIDAVAQDEHGNDLPIKVTDTTIDVTLPKPDRFEPERTFMLEYKLDGVLKKKGLLREITIPLITESEKMALGKQLLAVNYPSEWGGIQTESIKHSTLEESGGITSLSYDPADSHPNELKITIGPYQLYDVNLSYHLSNPNADTDIVEVAFPPDFESFQNVYIDEISPEPDDIGIDADGNLIGYYELAGNEQLNVTFSGQIRIDLTNPPQQTGKHENEISYLMPDKYWDVNAPEIQELAKQLHSAKDVYDYVTTTLTYSPKRLRDKDITRYGALGALQRPQSAVCMEFTDLTVTLLRAIRIPAREIDGYAYIDGETGDILHSWVQYYDENKGWTNIDPTWGATTGRDYFNSFDNDHVMFAIKGMSSQGPDPAGVYKIEGSDTKDIEVKLSDGAEIKFPEIEKWLNDYEYRHSPWWYKIWLKIKDLLGITD